MNVGGLFAGFARLIAFIGALVTIGAVIALFNGIGGAIIIALAAMTWTLFQYASLRLASVLAYYVGDRYQGVVR